jgi:hypothetical protein
MTIVFSSSNPSGENIEITKEELNLIRNLKDFDLTMFLSELNDFGWVGKTGGARKTLNEYIRKLYQ